MLKKIILLGLCLVLFGCNATVPKRTDGISKISLPSPDKSRVVFYRESRTYAMLRSAPISIDGTSPFDVNNGRVHIVDLNPGEHRFVHELWDIPGQFRISLVLEGGYIYPIKLVPKSSVGVAGALGGLVGVMANAAIEEQGGLFDLIPESVVASRDTLNELGYSVTDNPVRSEVEANKSDVNQTQARPNSDAEKLRMIQVLHRDGVISQEEYNRKKKEILDRM